MQTKYDYDYFKKSADYISRKIGGEVEIAIILGSALGSIAELIEEKTIIDYKDIPNFLLSTVENHEGKLIVGTLNGRRIICMSGRFHYYEGYEFEELVIPIRVFKLLGVNTVILTNAAGGINKDYEPGDIMIIKDHINLSGDSPLRGINIEKFGPRFVDLSDIYTKELRDKVKDVAKEINLGIKEGVYIYAKGPQFETPAEIRAYRSLGADAVGMSTVTESITAAHCNMRVLGLSLISNMAAGVLDKPITYEEVVEVGEKTKEIFKKLIVGLIKEIN